MLAAAELDVDNIVVVGMLPAVRLAVRNKPAGQAPLELQDMIGLGLPLEQVPH